MHTWLTERFGIDVPVVGAPMANVGGGRLAAAVSAAGGLGMIGVGNRPAPGWIAREAELAAGPGRPYGIGLLAWALEIDPSPLDDVLAARPALVSVSFGDYPQFLGPLRDAGLTVATQVGTLLEALEAERAGVDVIVVRGGEGGGHGRDDVATLPLLQLVLERVSTPVLAAGGVATARGLAAVLAAGAAGGWAGTAFLACVEADNTAEMRHRLVGARETDTAYGRVFDVGLRLTWPEQYGGRALRNAFFERWAGREAELAGDDAAHEHMRTARPRGDLDTAAIYAGQGVGLLTAERTAADVVAEFAGAGHLLRAAAGATGDSQRSPSVGAATPQSREPSST